MKIVKIENSYDIGDTFSSISLDKAWNKLVNYIKTNKNLYEKVNFLKDLNEIKIKSGNEETLDIIKYVDPNKYVKKSLIKTIKLNLKFNKETKNIEIDNSLNEIFDDINVINYNKEYEFNSKNDLYFDEKSILINYENITNEDFTNFEYGLGILFFIKTKIVKNLDNEILSENDSDEYMLIIYNKNTNKLKFINFEKLNKENEDFNLCLYIEKYNNNEEIDENIFNVKKDLEEYRFSNLKLKKTIITFKEPLEKEILSFKDGLNKYIFDNFINLQRMKS